MLDLFKATLVEFEKQQCTKHKAFLFSYSTHSCLERQLSKQNKQANKICQLLKKGNVEKKDK